jgi:phospholipid/cholesterol/gamma-HCH transport system substrate-binding protein
MITKRTKVQLLIFVAITLMGVSFVGARYAQLDRLFIDQSYRVNAHFADSGGIFAGAEVTYRGVTIGRIGEMELTEDGVDVMLDVDKEHDDIPADSKALVGNRSAVGEQYVELQPQSNGKPYLKDGSEIDQSDTAIPIETSKLLVDIQSLVNSVGKPELRTVVDEFGAAFHDGGDDLTRLIDSSTSFIDVANDNFELTQQLIRDSNTVLGTQLDKASAIQSFAKDLALFSDTLAASDQDLRRVITSGSATANQVRAFLEKNDVNLTKLLNNLVTTGEIQVQRLAETEMLLILYPYVVAGAFVVNDVTPGNNVYDAHFGLILEQSPPACKGGYNARERDPEDERGNAPMDVDAQCTEAPTQSNPRGVQNAQRVAPGDAKQFGSYDRSTGEVTYAGEAPATDVTYTGGADAALGKESWKWLLLQPLMQEK